MSQPLTVRAAGGVVVRRREGGPADVAVVHRPRYDDWTLPKGKLMAGESHEEAALREVEEETGLVCRLGRPAGRLSYRDRRGREKVVRYWVMLPVGGEFARNDEVDELRWLSFAEAIKALTYPRDRKLLEGLDAEEITAQATFG